MLTIEEFNSLSIAHGIDRFILKEICEKISLNEVEIEERLKSLDRKFDDKLCRLSLGFTNEKIHNL